jgi:hypothetical protein
MPSTRRRVLAAVGGVGGAVLGGAALQTGLLADATPTARGAWPMGRRGPAGRSYAPDADPPTDDVAVRWKRPVAPLRGFGHEPTPVVADGHVRWRFGLEREDGDSGPLSPAALVGDRLYVAGNRHVYALEEA